MAGNSEEERLRELKEIGVKILKNSNFNPTKYIATSSETIKPHAEIINEIDSLLTSNQTVWLRHKFLIKNFEYFSGEKSLSAIYSDAFPLSNKVKFSLRLLPNYIQNEDQIAYLSVFLYLENCLSQLQPIHTRYRVSIIDSNGRKCYSKEKIDNFQPELSHGWPDFVELAHILDPSNGILYRGHFMILCEIELENENSEAMRSKSEQRIFESKSKFNGRANINQIDHLWRIENFSSFFFEGNVQTFVQTEIIPTKQVTKNRYILRLWPKGIDNEQSNDFVSLFLFVTDFEVAFQYRLSVLDRNGDVFHTGEGRMYSTSAKSKSNSKTPIGKGSTKYLPLNSIRNIENGLLPGDTLLIFCEIEEIIELTSKVAIRENIEVKEIRTINVDEIVEIGQVEKTEKTKDIVGNTRKIDIIKTDEKEIKYSFIESPECIQDDREHKINRNNKCIIN